MITLLRRNKDKALWQVIFGNRDLHTGSGAVMGSVVAKDLGDGTGPRWPFSIEFVNLAR